MIPFVEKHGALVALFLPLVAVMMVHTDMAELIEYGYNGRVSSSDDFHVGQVAGCRGHARTRRWRCHGSCAWSKTRRRDNQPHTTPPWGVLRDLHVTRRERAYLCLFCVGS